MLNTTNVLTARRSIRHYTGTPVDLTAIKTLLNAALCAPSAHNAQPWRFAVLTTAEAKEHLANAMGARFASARLANGTPPEQVELKVTRSIKRITSAPVVIVACLAMVGLPATSDKKLEHIMAMQSVAAAIQNLLLAAHEHGLGACWMCAPLFAPEETRATLGLPTDWEPQALITVGYPARLPRPKTIRPLEDCTLFR